MSLRAMLLCAALVAAGCGDKSKPAPPAASVPAAPRPDPAAEKLHEAKEWYANSFFDELAKRRELDGAAVVALCKTAEERGYDTLRGFDWEAKKRSQLGYVLDDDPNDPDANRAIGRVPLADYPDFFAVFRRMTDAKALPREFAAFRNKWEDRVRYEPVPRAPALPPEEWPAVRALLDRWVAFDRVMRENPTQAAIFEARERIRIDPLLGDYETVHIEVPPFVLFYASRELVPRDDSEAEARRVREKGRELQHRLESFTTLIKDLLVFFRARWVEPLKLPEFEERDLLFVWVFADRETFDEYGEKKGLKPPPSILGYFSPQSHWVFLYEDPAERITVETTLAHELTHQLHWYFSRDRKLDAVYHFERGKTVWFSEGWAEYVGWCRRDGDHYRFAQESPGRLAVFHACRKNKLPVFPLRKILAPWNYVEWMREVRTWYRNEWQEKTKVPWEAVPDLYFSMLYSEGWLFMRFLYEYDGGKYRPAILAYTKGALRGFRRYKIAEKQAAPDEVFRYLMKLKTDEDWDRLQQEFDGYLDAMLAKHPPK